MAGDYEAAFAASADFERRLDPTWRARLGAYYTPREDILLLVEPVLMQPLRREWTALQKTATALCVGAIRESPLQRLRDRILRRLRTITVLDPACGAGNFLIVALHSLMALEREVIDHPLWANLPPETPQVHPRQLFGIEKDGAACEVARRALHPIPPDNIRCVDAILAFASDGTPRHPRWQTADVIISNPPFLGSRKLRPELGDAYVESLMRLYTDSFGRHTPDLVCYWFEQARRQLLTGQVQRVGFLATNSIRGGTNRLVLERIAHSGRIFMAWSDRAWQQNGAAVNVSLIAFDRGEEPTTLLDGQPVSQINPDLSCGVDVTAAKPLVENRRIAFQGIIQRGAFDIPENIAHEMLAADPANAEVVKPICNGTDITRRPRHRCVIDFGRRSYDEARHCALPFAYVEQHVKPVRAQTHQARARDRWWQHWNPRPEMQQALASLPRYIATPAVSKHRVFVWLERGVQPDHALIVFARADDTFFGVLHSRFHTLWAARLGTSLEDRPRYTPTSVFETFPFPWLPGEEDTTCPTYQAIANTARQLDTERRAWLGEDDGSKRTLTRLYNALDALGSPSEGLKPLVHPGAAEFAPRLRALHDTLDRAVCAAYGWSETILEDEQAILGKLLALNRERRLERGVQ